MVTALEHLDTLPDPRVARTIHHILRGVLALRILALRILAVIGGAWAGRSRRMLGQVKTRARSGCSVIVSLLALACTHDKGGVEVDSGGYSFDDRVHTIVKVVEGVMHETISA